jgi:hypothetical protein
MTMSSFLSRWTGRPEREESLLPDADRSPPDALPVPKRRNQSLAWAASPSLERIHRELDEQIRAIEEAKRLLEERLSPFQRHLWEQRRNVDQALKQLEARFKPVRQYIEGQEHNLERVGMHLNTELKDQFDTFEKFLAEQRQILERAQRYLEEQPRPMASREEDGHPADALDQGLLGARQGPQRDRVLHFHHVVEDLIRETDEPQVDARGRPPSEVGQRILHERDRVQVPVHDRVLELQATHFPRSVGAAGGAARHTAHRPLEVADHRILRRRRLGTVALRTIRRSYQVMRSSNRTSPSAASS